MTYFGVSYLVSWCFEPSQPQRVTSGLKEAVGKADRQTEEEVGRQHQGMDRPRVRQVPEGCGERGKMEESCCGVPTTPEVKGQVKVKKEGWQQ